MGVLALAFLVRLCLALGCTSATHKAPLSQFVGSSHCKTFNCDYLDFTPYHSTRSHMHSHTPDVPVGEFALFVTISAFRFHHLCSQLKCVRSSLLVMAQERGCDTDWSNTSLLTATVQVVSRIQSDCLHWLLHSTALTSKKESKKGHGNTKHFQFPLHLCTSTFQHFIKAAIIYIFLITMHQAKIYTSFYIMYIYIDDCLFYYYSVILYTFLSTLLVFLCLSFNVCCI